MRYLTAPPGRVRSVRFTPDRQGLIVLTEEPLHWSDLGRTLELYQHAYRIDLTSGSVSAEWSFLGSEIAGVSPDARSLYHAVSVACTGWECDLRRIDLTTGRSVTVLQTDEVYVQHMAFSPNGHLLALGGIEWCGDGGALVWRHDTINGTTLDPIKLGTGDDLRIITDLAYSPDGQTLAVACRLTGVWFWRKRAWGYLPGRAGRLAWSAAGRLAWGFESVVAAGLPEQLNHVWSMELAGAKTTALGFTPDDERLLVGMEDGAVVILNACSGHVITRYDWQIGVVHSLCCSPDGLTGVAGGDNGRVVVWDMDS